MSQDGVLRVLLGSPQIGEGPRRNQRRSTMTEICDNALYDEALDRFTHLFLEAKKTGQAEASVATLATVGENGRPTLRTMTINHFDKHGLVFFTSSGSRKGRQLSRQPHAALCFHWGVLNEQVTIEGPVVRMPEDDAVKWWVSRSRDNQFAAWASEQSARLDNRETLQKRLAKCREQFIDGRVPKPPHWCGYRLDPERIEFWHGGWRHLHERVCYQRGESGWEKFLLSP